MSNKKSPHKLCNPKFALCRGCGKLFSPKVHNTKYCSSECKKNNSKDWNKIRTDFYKDNPHLCSSCGCDNSGSRFRACLDCRRKQRISAKKSREKIKNE